MIKSNSNKIFSISGFSFITSIHDGNFASINMNNTLKIYMGKNLEKFKSLKSLGDVENFFLK